GVITSFGAAALGLSQEFQPVAITLDISLPDINGYWVLERMKNDMATRHIPVYVITTDDHAERGLRLGARMVLTKPLPTGEALERRPPECVVLNPRLPDVPALDFAKRLLKNGPARTLSVLVHGDADSEEEVEAVKRALPGLTVKPVRTEQRLLDQTALYLHRRFGDLSATQRRILSDLHGGSRALGGKKALIVDDDIRNIFALTSVLEEHHMLVVSAENGRDAVKTLQAYADIDVVVMDIMMPQMDGMETTRQIRLDPRFRHVPIIAVTAKA